MNKALHSIFSTTNSLLSFSLLLAFIFYSQTAQACFDPDTVATLTINYSDDFSEVEIRIGNLKLETEDSNTFCSCGLASETQVFTYVTYIAIVYQSTNVVYPNFIPFMQTSPADAAWDGSQPALPDWNGYVAEVINGLVADDAVEMIIRAEAPPGVLVELQDNPDNQESKLYYQTYLGSDEYNPNTMNLEEDHQAVRTFGFMEGISVNVLPQDYFDELDEQLITSIYEVGEPPIQAGKILPNPVSDYFELSFELLEASDLNIVIYDITGKTIYQIPNQRFEEGIQTMPISLEGIIPKTGIYIVSLQSSSGQSKFKFIKQ